MNCENSKGTVSMFDLESLQAQLRRAPLGEVVKKAGIPRSTLEDIKTGRTANPGIRTIEAIQRALSDLANPRKNGRGRRQ